MKEPERWASAVYLYKDILQAFHIQALLSLPIATRIIRPPCDSAPDASKTNSPFLAKPYVLSTMFE